MRDIDHFRPKHQSILEELDQLNKELEDIQKLLTDIDIEFPGWKKLISDIDRLGYARQLFPGDARIEDYFMVPGGQVKCIRLQSEFIDGVKDIINRLDTKIDRLKGDRFQEGGVITVRDETKDIFNQMLCVSGDRFLHMFFERNNPKMQEHFNRMLVELSSQSYAIGAQRAYFRNLFEEELKKMTRGEFIRFFESKNTADYLIEAMLDTMERMGHSFPS